MRIANRASRRCGELLKQFDAKGKNQHSIDDYTTLSQKDIAEQSGLSEHQQVTSVRIANIPEDKFNELVESD